MVAEWETDLNSMVERNASGVHASAKLAELFRVSRATVHRTIQRERAPPNDPR